MRPASLITVLFLSLIAVAHLLRLVFQVEVVAGGTTIPMGVSVLGCVVPGALAFALWREVRASEV
jgi:uncharacterized integral membrane protein